MKSVDYVVDSINRKSSHFESTLTRKSKKDSQFLEELNIFRKSSSNKIFMKSCSSGYFTKIETLLEDLDNVQDEF